nr:alpha-amylase [Chloroflexota bacterium]
MTDARDTTREVPVARVARERYAFDEPLLPPIEMPTAAASARRLARLIAERRDPAEPTPPRARQLQAMALIHEAMHRVIQAHGDDAGQTLLGEMLVKVGRDVGSDALEEALLAYAAQFPVLPVYRGELPAEEYLEERSGGRPHREVVLEELLLLWLANRNPAFIRHGDLFDELPVARTSLYPEVVESMRRHLASAGEPDEDLVGLLLSPALESPDSLAGQLRYIRDHWPEARALVDALGADLDLLADLERGVGVDDDDDGIATPAFGMGGPGETDTEALHGFAGLDSETERYSQDRDWMPRTVLMAKSTYVWLDQLSRRYERPIRTLDAIPDEELESLAAQGFTGLWLIGVWERSVASKLIKQRRGNPEAVASAYSLMDYRISEDLGGEAAFAALRERSMGRGIRLACDMVPNHMGIDSRWVVEHPDFFISRPDSPFPAYSFSGPNLSTDERAGIYLEDHYDDGSDAAVVFRRVDRWSGEERYVYHGNDGTGMPWNDTAQLDYLREDVREAVIETILAVARRAPIIRFDAAMTLARRHVQRLWYPVLGSGESIASRAESAMDPREFAERMPEEFWRQVVDRVATEAPDTLLLAEAFWLMEGYFVRTLGMHRVYNSAFMHMLRDEDNAGYRTVIRNTLAFDPEI